MKDNNISGNFCEKNKNQKVRVKRIGRRAGLGETSGRSRRRGAVMVEFAMTAVLLLVMALCTFDLGFYAYAFISIQNAARSAALHNSGGLGSAADQSTACEIAIRETEGLPNIDQAAVSGCSEAPLQVSSALCEGTTSCLGSTTSADGEHAAVVQIAYTLPPLFRITQAWPASISRTVQMKVRNIP